MWTATQVVECSRCGGSTSVTDAAELRHKQDKQYRRRLCADCLKEVAVPSDYRVVRDFAP